MLGVTMSLCSRCSWVRITRGKHGQHYLLCRNDAISGKYPPQPVLRCPAFEAAPPPLPATLAAEEQP